MTEIRILRVPPGHKVREDPRIDRVETDPDIDAPVVVTKNVPSGDEEVVDRRRISPPSKKTVADQRRSYNAAKATGDLQTQVDALEVIVDDLWNIVSGNTLDETETEYPADDETAA
ncbi:hypothetical protein HCTV-15_gp36 [Haloarcula virus HCTV-15]|nr:hypothetical protein HCTV-6_gp36 [Haloarcula virus HCTV-6]UBF22510.1 hypothetical protein HCTV-15_gp36 [Haloarcula virus HCTV-15]